MDIFKKGVRHTTWIVQVDNTELCECFNKDFADYIVKLLKKDIPSNDRDFSLEIYSKVKGKEYDFMDVK